MEKAITWDEVLKREDLIGGDIQWFENGPVYRGPLSGIERREGRIWFTSPWFAKKMPDQKWKNYPGAKTVTAAEEGYQPKDMGDGTVQVTMFFALCTVLTVTLFPKGSSQNLDPSEVEGLMPPAE